MGYNKIFYNCIAHKVPQKHKSTFLHPELRVYLLTLMKKINQMVKSFIFLIPVSVNEEKREKIYTFWNPSNCLFLLYVICTSDMRILKK